MLITVGRGKNVPQGRRVDAGPDLAEGLDLLDSSVESWWSPHLWGGDRRAADAWEGAHAVAVDVDYSEAGKHAETTEPARQAALHAWETALLPGSCYHATPRGLRLVFVLDRQASIPERDVYVAAVTGACELARRACVDSGLAALGFAVDAQATDLARFLYSPRAIVNGSPREARVLGRERVYTLSELAASDPTPLPPTGADDPIVGSRRLPNMAIEAAVARFNAEHPGAWPKSDGLCPACGHDGCFGFTPKDPTRWFCFSTGHGDRAPTCGLKSPSGYHGDALDIAAHAAGCERMELLRREGLLPHAGETCGPTPSEPVTKVTEGGGGATCVTSVTDFGPLVALPAEVEPPPFPVRVLSPWLGRWVHADAEALQCPPDLPAVLALCVLAVGAAGKRRVRVSEGHYESLNIYAAVALPSGEKKSPAFRAALEPVRDWEAEERRRVKPERDRAVAKQKTLEKRLDRAQRKAAEEGGSDAEVNEAVEALARHVVPALPQLVVEDVTPDKLGMLLAEQGGRLAQFSDEGAPLQVLAGRYSDKGANLELFNKAHSQTPYMCDRVTRDSVRVERPTLTVGLAVQPDVIAGLAATKSFRYTGTLARFLFSLPVSRLGERAPDPSPVPPEVRADYLSNVRALLALEAPKDDAGEYVPQTLALDASAHARLVRFRADLERRLHPEGDLRGMADWTNKAQGGTAVRLAGLLHLADRSGDAPGDLAAPIGLDAMERALVLVDYFLAHARMAFDLMEATPETKRLRALVKWLRKGRPERVTVRDVHRALHLDEADQARRALETLEGRGYVRRAEPQGQRPSGRPSEEYAVNPATWAEPATRDGRQPGEEG